MPDIANAHGKSVQYYYKRRQTVAGGDAELQLLGRRVDDIAHEQSAYRGKKKNDNVRIFHFSN